MTVIRRYLKAHVAGIGTALALIGADLSNQGAVSLTQWYVVALTAIGVGSAVAIAPNRPAATVTPPMSAQDTVAAK